MNDVVFLRGLADSLDEKRTADAKRLRDIATRLDTPIRCGSCGGSGKGPLVQGIVSWNRAVCSKCHGLGTCLP